MGRLGKVSVILNGKLLETNPHSAYNKGSTVMIPLREASNALKYTTTYQKSSETITLTRINEIIKWKLNEHQVSINDAQELFLKMISNSERVISMFQSPFLRQLV